jgi:hypothetical protein
VTAAGVHTSPPDATPAHAPALPARGWLRLPWLYLVSRRAPGALALLAGLGALLWTALHWHWNIAGGPAFKALIPLVIETGAAGLIAVTTYGPFGEPERATGRWLPWLRLGAAVLLTAAAFGLLAAGATAGALPGGALALLRNLAGITGTGLLAAAVAGGAFGWVGPMAYWLITEGALAHRSTSPWVWPGRLPHDRGAAICAALAFAAGVAVSAVRGPKEGVRE